MNRRVPEFALVSGVALAVPVALYAWYFGQPLDAVAAFVVLGYPFAAYAAVTDDDPTNVLVPDYVLVAACALAGGTVLVGAAGARPWFGLFVATLAVLPAVAYHARYGEPVDPLPPLVSAGIAAWVALGIAAFGLAFGGADGAAASAGLLLVGAADYWRVRDGGGAGSRERYATFACLALAVLVVAVWVFLGAGAGGAALGVGLVTAALRLSG